MLLSQCYSIPDKMASFFHQDPSQNETPHSSDIQWSNHPESNDDTLGKSLSFPFGILDDTTSAQLGASPYQQVGAEHCTISEPSGPFLSNRDHFSDSLAESNFPQTLNAGTFQDFHQVSADIRMPVAGHFQSIQAENQPEFFQDFMAEHSLSYTNNLMSDGSAPGLRESKFSRNALFHCFVRNTSWKRQCDLK